VIEAHAVDVEINGVFVPDTWNEGLGKLPYPPIVRDSFKKFKKEIMGIDVEKRGEEMFNVPFSSFMKLYAGEIGLGMGRTPAASVIEATAPVFEDVETTLEDLKTGRNVPLKAEAAGESALPGTIDQLAQGIRQNLALSRSRIKELEAQAFKPSTKSLPALRDYTQGLQLLREGRNLGAQKALQTSTQEDPGFALAYAKLAEADAGLGYGDQAELASQKAVSLSENLPPQEKYRIGASHARIMKAYPKAIEAYENLIKVSPNDSDVQFALAGLYEDTGDFEKARQHYQQILATNPKDLVALLAVGRVESNSGNPKGSLEPLNRALGLAIEVDNQEQKALVLQALGIIYAQLNKPDEALRNYQQSLEIKRHLGFKRGIADSLAMIAQAYDGLGKSDLALKNYTAALQGYRELGDKQDVGDELLNLGQFYDDRGKYDQALKLFQESLRIERDLGNENNAALCLNNIGNTYLFKGDYENARTYFEQALQLREKFNVPGDIADTVHNLAEVSTKMGQYDQALAQYLKALELRRKADDQHGAAIESNGMATIFGYQGRYGAAVDSRKEALAGLRQLNERSFWMAAVLGGYGAALSQAGRFDDSRQSLGEALGLARELKNEALTALSLDWQGDSFFYAGDLKAARPLYAQAAQLAAKTSDHRLLLLSKLNEAKLLVKEGRSQTAISALRSLSPELDTLGEEYLSVEASLYQAEALLNIKDYPRAQQELERDLARSEKLGLRPLGARSHYLLATCLRLTNKGPEAATHYQQALRLLDDIRSQPGAEKVLQRADLNSIYTDSTRWLQSAKK
jgi:tetratricopeptide (TPR) repeat protein